MTTREFLQSLRVGDVLRINGSVRIIRGIRWRKYGNYPPTAVFTFAIKRCSWTGKGYTCINSSDLMQKNIEIIGRNFKSKLELDSRLDSYIADKSLHKVTCREIVGVLD